MKYLWYMCYAFICISTLTIWLVEASADRFELEVRPNPFGVNQAVDLIVKVVNNDGSVVKDYDKDVFIEWDKLSDSEIELPWGWIYQFQATDQGNKIFSKGIVIKKEGTFKIMVSDILDDKIRWEVNVTVTKNGEWQASGYITIISPVADGIESESSIHVYGRSELKNSPLDLYLDWVKIKDTKTSNNGDFSIYLNDITSGAHLLQLKIKDMNDTVIWSSEEIRFTYTNAGSNLFKTLDILPSEVVKIGTKTALLVKTLETVSTTEIIFPDSKKIILDRIWPGEFKKEFIADTPWSYPLTVKLTTDTQKKQYDKVKTLTVLANAMLWPVKAMRVQSNPSQIDLNWTYSWQIAQFKIIYGFSPESLDLQVISQSPTLTIWDTDIHQTYYFKVYPQDSLGNDVWAASTIVKVWPISAANKINSTCVIWNIDLSSKKIWDSYYITRNKAPGAIKYHVYRSEEETDNLTKMVKVWETVYTKFEYPFDPKSSKELYAYYRVEWICADNKTTKLSNVKEVKVWPKENIMMLILIWLIVYSMFQLKAIKKS